MNRNWKASGRLLLYALFGSLISWIKGMIIRNRGVKVFLVADSEGFRWSDTQGNKGAILPSPILEVPIHPNHLPVNPQKPK